MISVHNLHHGKPAGKGDYIGRPRTLGNPFVIGADGSRAEVIEKYKRWLWSHVKQGEGKVWEKMMALLAEARAGDVKLLCHCKPLPCHGDAIKACLEWMMKEPLKEPLNGGTVESLNRTESETSPGSTVQPFNRSTVQPFNRSTPPREQWEPSDNDGGAE